MSLKYLHPQQGLPVSADNLSELTEQLARLAVNQHVHFLTQPFPLETEFLQQMRTSFGYEKLQEKLTFSAQVPLHTLTLESLEQLNRLHFTELQLPLLIESCDLAQLEAILTQARTAKLKIQLLLKTEVATPPLSALVKLYFFLQNHIGWYGLEYAPALFSDPTIARRFDRLARISQDTRSFMSFQQLFNERIYTLFYEFLRTRLSHHVKTILEINPFADEPYFRDLPRQPYPWKVTLLSLPQHMINQQTLKEWGKTFDAIVFYQGLETLRDPKKELLLLQKYTRPTTEWVFFSYNMASTPTLLRLLANHFDNIFSSSTDFRLLKLFSQSSLEKLFEFLGIRFQFMPTRLPLGEVQQQFEQIRPLFDNHLPESWKAVAENFDVMAFTAIGTLEIEEAADASDGFISSGFLS
ncbi:MAG: hypothetical protein IV090_04235 [Candidatus Sericytochromatia bacterium]|nr:hypothetical protein [Candidatus Sericytochromatia bacterium]